MHIKCVWWVVLSILVALALLSVGFAAGFALALGSALGLGSAFAFFALGSGAYVTLDDVTLCLFFIGSSRTADDRVGLITRVGALSQYAPSA